LTPDKILSRNDFGDAKVIFTGLGLAVFLSALAYFSRRLHFKAHFAFSYANFGAHLLFISCLAGLFEFANIDIIWFAGLTGITAFFYRKAIQERSFYYILILTLYAYIGISYMVMKFLLQTNFSEGSIYLAFSYFIASAIGLILFLIRMNKKMKTL
jgi:hypothetical protein